MRFYKLVALVSGFVILAVEITAFRIVAPYFGNSIFITTNLLGIVLAGLALGYWLGGRRADKHSSSNQLYQLMIFAAVILALIPFGAPPLFSFLREHIGGLDWTLIALSLLGGFAIFFIPFVMLGMISPWLIKLANKQLATTGRIAGNIYAWSTIGSLLGTFIPTWITVPLIGSKISILIFAGLMGLTAAIGLGKIKWALPGAMILLFALILKPGYYTRDKSIIAEAETPIEYLRVMEQPDGTRKLLQDEGFGTHSIYNPADYLTGFNFEWMSATPALLDNLSHLGKLRIGLIGLAGGTTARQLEHYYGPKGEDPHQLQIDGVEIDKKTIELAQQYFGLTNKEVPSLRAEVGDGRVWLSQRQQPYDIILLDAFRQLYIPPHLSSQEFFKEARDKLLPGGILVANLNVTDTESLVYKKMASTIRSVFPHVLAVPIPNTFNVHFYASMSELDPKAMQKQNKIEDLETLSEQFEKIAKPITDEPIRRLIATDDRPLVEGLYDLMVGRFLVSVDDKDLYL